MESTGVRYSNELHILDLGHRVDSPSNGQQGDMPYRIT